MCGLVGIYCNSTANDKQLALFQNLLYVDKIRGEHATGVIKINPWRDTVAIHKRAVSAQIYLGQEDALEFMDKERGRIYVGHNRYATVGDKTADANAHPFQEGHITMVHNGGVDAWTRDKLEGHKDADVVVDSHQVCKTIAEIGIEATVPKLSGAFALIWWDDQKKSLNFLRNKERPLWIGELNDGTVVWASEREFIDFFVERKRSTMSYKMEPKELPLETLVSFTFNKAGVADKKPTLKPMPFSPRVPDPKPVSYGNYYGSGYVGNNHSNRQQSTPFAYDDRVNRILDFWKLGVKNGDTIKMKVESLESVTHSSRTNEPRVNVHLTFENCDVVVYYVEKSKVEGAKFLTGKISNAREKTVNYSGTCWQEVELVVSADTVQRVVAETPSVTPMLALVTGASFPMKCHGHTFNNRVEFTDFVSKGCSMCGMIPAAQNKENKSLSVYQGDTFTGLLKECEFICGKCVEEGENQNEQS